MSPPSFYQQLSNLTTLFPFWSYVIHIVVILLVVGFKKVLITSKVERRWMSSPSFRFLNEFLVSIVWVVCSLECTVVGVTWSRISVLVVMALRLLLAPPFLSHAHFNPCCTFYQYLLNDRTGRRMGSIWNYVLHFLAEVLAIPVGMLLSLAMWKFLALYNISQDHTHFLKAQPDFFLSVSTLAGFSIELSVSFVMFLPGILFSETQAIRVMQVLLVTLLVSVFGPLTGAFMNPMVALSYLLMWHHGILDTSSIAVHLFVFWVGPLVGTAMAVGVARRSFQKQHIG